MARALRFQAGLPLKFWGDCVLQKGYRLLNLMNNIVCVSRDVKFYENLFPYQEMMP